MIIILVLLAICIAISALIWRNDVGDGQISAVICAVIMCIIFGIVWGTSYSTYLDMRASYDTVVTQYRDSVTMYENKAILNVKQASFTDFKYEGYQSNISDFIKSLRKQVVIYNRTFIKKRAMKKNIILNWCIVGADNDMKLIGLKE
jgi:archaellum component FlaF (FlaF/FlaG flagellin family)